MYSIFKAQKFTALFPSLCEARLQGPFLGRLTLTHPAPLFSSLPRRFSNTTIFSSSERTMISWLHFIQVISISQLPLHFMSVRPHTGQLTYFLQILSIIKILLVLCNHSTDKGKENHWWSCCSLSPCCMLIFFCLSLFISTFIRNIYLQRSGRRHLPVRSPFRTWHSINLLYKDFNGHFGWLCLCFEDFSWFLCFIVVLCTYEILKT